MSAVVKLILKIIVDQPVDQPHSPLHCLDVSSLSDFDLRTHLLLARSPRLSKVETIKIKLVPKLGTNSEGETSARNFGGAVRYPYRGAPEARPSIVLSKPRNTQAGPRRAMLPGQGVPQAPRGGGCAGIGARPTGLGAVLEGLSGPRGSRPGKDISCLACPAQGHPFDGLCVYCIG